MLVLDAHLTLSFAAGSVLNIKSGRAIELEQRTTGRVVWAPDDRPRDPAWPSWSFKQQQGKSDGEGIVVTVSLTHDVAAAVSN
ncbi:SAVED domain-containing protein, partial [Rhizobium ruizarguesonis]